MIDVEGLHAGELTVDQSVARAAATAFIDANAPDASVATDSSPAQMCATVAVTHRTIALVFIGVGDVEVRARSCAEPAVG